MRRIGWLMMSPPLLVNHHRQRRTADIARTTEVDGDVALPGFLVVFEEISFGTAIHGVVDDHMHAAKLGLHLCHKALHRSPACNIALLGHDFRARRARLGRHGIQLTHF